MVPNIRESTGYEIGLSEPDKILLGLLPGVAEATQELMQYLVEGSATHATMLDMAPWKAFSEGGWGYGERLKPSPDSGTLALEPWFLEIPFLAANPTDEQFKTVISGLYEIGATLSVITAAFEDHLRDNPDTPGQVKTLVHFGEIRVEAEDYYGFDLRVGLNGEVLDYVSSHQKSPDRVWVIEPVADAMFKGLGRVSNREHLVKDNARDGYSTGAFLENGRLTLHMPGSRSNVYTRPQRSGDWYEELETHNLDNVFQQFGAIVGLAALSDLYRLGHQ